jgi:threonine dehydrogenase-like Zn-dependent dehydrogenase
MRATILDAPGDVRGEERPDPTVLEPTGTVIGLAATCVCGSDLWPHRGGVDAGDGRAPMGHEYCGIAEEVATTSPRSGPAGS